MAPLLCGCTAILKASRKPPPPPSPTMPQAPRSVPESVAALQASRAVGPVFVRFLFVLWFHG